MIFVFGSNLAGRHGKGAALYARRHHGAVYGQGVGLQGDSYTIPTKDEHLRTLPLETIRGSVEEFKEFARNLPEMTFQVTAIGCGPAVHYTLPPFGTDTRPGGREPVPVGLPMPKGVRRARWFAQPSWAPIAGGR
jgi:hypothetical protein